MKRTPIVVDTSHCMRVHVPCGTWSLILTTSHPCAARHVYYMTTSTGISAAHDNQSPSASAAAVRRCVKQTAPEVTFLLVF